MYTYQNKLIDKHPVLIKTIVSYDDRCEIFRVTPKNIKRMLSNYLFNYKYKKSNNKRRSIAGFYVQRSELKQISLFNYIKLWIGTIFTTRK